jgi:amino-acid N-acetyltransferase
MPATTPTEIRAARATDAPAVRAMLVDSKLPLDGVPDDLAHFLVAEREGRVVGAIGLELYGDAGLLRSAVVSPALRGTGVGEQLVNALLANARASGARDVVLLTTTAEKWFPRFGFERTTRAEVPASLHASEEFRGACPDTAVVMHRSLA